MAREIVREFEAKLIRVSDRRTIMVRVTNNVEEGYFPHTVIRIDDSQISDLSELSETEARDEIDHRYRGARLRCRLYGQEEGTNVVWGYVDVILDNAS